MTDRNPLNILHVSTETGWRGGEQQVKLVTDGLLARHHNVRVLSPPGAHLLQDREAAGIGHPLPIRLGEFDPIARKKILNTARDMQAHLIHAQTSHAHSLALHAAKKLNIPLIVSRRVDFPVAINPLSRRKYLHPSVRYIAISHAIKNILANAGIPTEHIHVVHSGVNPNRYPHRGQTRDEELARHWGAQPGTPLILNAAALTDHKDQTTLLKAAAILKQHHTNFRLIIAGSGELENHLKTLATNLNLNEHVHFPGYVDLATLYPAADLFVISSHLEGLCTSILDAMSVGIPVIATHTGGIPEIVRHDENGLLAEPRNPQDLAEKITHLLQNPHLANRFRTAGKETITKGFTHPVMIDGIQTAYYEILQS